MQYPYILPGAETVPAARAAGPRSGPPGSEAAMQLREISVRHQFQAEVAFQSIKSEE